MTLLRPASLGTAATAALGILMTASAAAAPADSTPADATPAVPAPAAAHAPIRSGSPASAVDRVADFYGAYIDADYGHGMGNLGHDLRTHYLTRGLQRTLAGWEAKQHADGVLRAQDVPNGWAVTAADAGAGHVWSTVVLTWGGKHPTHTRLSVQSDLATGLISDIRQ